ncbi:hypothetical protein ACYT69_10445, partial [Streptococcus pyogenes]
ELLAGAVQPSQVIGVDVRLLQTAKRLIEIDEALGFAVVGRLEIEFGKLLQRDGFFVEMSFDTFDDGDDQSAGSFRAMCCMTRWWRRCAPCL